MSWERENISSENAGEARKGGRSPAAEREHLDKIRAAVLEHMLEGVSLATEDGFLVYVNPSLERMFGYGHGELIGSHVSRLNSYPETENLRRVSEVIAQLKREGSWGGDWHNIRKDGTEFVTRAQISELEIGGESFWICVQDELTNELQTREELKKSEARFRKLVESTSVIAWEADLATGQFTYVSPQAEDILGYPAEKWYEPDFWPNHMHPEDRDWAMAYCLEAARTKPQYEFEYRMLRKDGAVAWMRDIVSVVDARDGRRLLTGFLIDITREKEAQEALERGRCHLERAVEERTAELQKSRAFLDSLVENLPNMVFVKDARELRFVSVNRAGEELVGVGREELIGKNDYDFFPREQADFFTAKDRATLETGTLLDIPEEFIETRGRGRRILHTKKIPIHGPDGKPEYLLGISEDITDSRSREAERIRLLREQVALEESERAARQAVQAREEFLSIASHELKTPITSLKLQLQMTQRRVDPETGEAPNPEKLKEVLDVAMTQVNRLAVLVDDLLDVSRVAAGKLAYSFAPVDVSRLVSDMVDRYCEQLRVAGCKVTVRAPAGIFARGDRVRLEQVLLNLLSNAAKYGSGKPIEVTAELVGASARISVRDEGIGIPENMRERIFERFERVASSSNITGLGLGLYITREIVAAHCGTIRVESREGHGSTFIVDLPVAAPAN